MIRNAGYFMMGNSQLWKDCVAYFKLDETSGTTVIDSVSGNNGTNNGATVNVAGKINRAYSFTVNDYVNIDAVLTPLSSATQGTWTAWVKPVDATPSSGKQLITFGNAATNTYLTLFIRGTTGTLRALAVDGSAPKYDVATDDSLFSDNTWAHIALVQNGVSPVLYVNGVAVSQTVSGLDQAYWINSFSVLDTARLACLDYNGGGNQFFHDGEIDEVGFWIRALSATEIAYIYNSGNGKTYPS